MCAGTPATAVAMSSLLSSACLRLFHMVIRDGARMAKDVDAALLEILEVMLRVDADGSEQFTPLCGTFWFAGACRNVPGPS